MAFAFDAGSASGTVPIVYIVDDDEAVRDSLGLLLESHGIGSEAYDSASTFLSAYRDGRGSCLVLDIQMPGMSGLEMLEKLARHRFALPVIVMTGYADAALVARALDAGARTVIDKPFREHELLAAIKEALSFRAV
jgi:FixJ family two-component response regulator